MKRALEYLQSFQAHRVTMLLSIFGFIGSLAFYVSVLRGIDGGTVQDQIFQRLIMIENKLDTIRGGPKPITQ